MPLKPEIRALKEASGRPYVVGIYHGMSYTQMMCKVKDNPNTKENRIILKHLVVNKNGAMVYQEFLPPGTVLEFDKAGVAQKAILPDKTERTQTIKDMAEVCVDLDKYDRDGVGTEIRGNVNLVV